MSLWSCHVVTLSTRVLHPFMNCSFVFGEIPLWSCLMVTLPTRVLHPFMYCSFVLSKTTLCSCFMGTLCTYYRGCVNFDCSRINQQSGWINYDLTYLSLHETVTDFFYFWKCFANNFYHLDYYLTSASELLNIITSLLLELCHNANSNPLPVIKSMN